MYYKYQVRMTFMIHKIVNVVVTSTLICKPVETDAINAFPDKLLEAYHIICIVILDFFTYLYNIICLKLHDIYNVRRLHFT